MNQFKRVSNRISWCELKRLQSSLSVSNSKIQIPARIKRNPIDILNALESTIPRDSVITAYVYHNDPFLLPQRSRDYRSYALSYEAGKKAAMWIHNEHRDLFPKNLSDPEVEAFKPLEKYTDKSQVSEEILLRTITLQNVSEAIHIYNLLEGDVSNEAKQALLELLCFYSNCSDRLNEFPYEQWFTVNKQRSIWQYSEEGKELYQHLITQDPRTAAAAYNAMICGLTRCLRADEAWAIYQECTKNHVPLNLTTYNYVLLLIPEVLGKKNSQKGQLMLGILKSMNEQKIKPNVRTLNAALKAIVTLPTNEAENIVKHLFMEFKKLNIKFSLASYYYAMHVFTQKGDNSHGDLMGILQTVENETFTFEDPEDSKFFSYAMYLAQQFFDRKAGDKIHNLLLTGSNRKFISNAMMESHYYTSYISLLLSTSTIDKFFESYEKIVPNMHVPKKRLLQTIINELKYYAPKVVAKYVSRLWSDVTTFHYTDSSLKFSMLSLMRIDALPIDSHLRKDFTDAAVDCWNDIKREMEKKIETQISVETAITGRIASMLLHGDRVQEGVEVLTYTVNYPDFFVPTMEEGQMNELFETCISKECVAAAFLVLEYAVNSGFPNISNMTTKLCNLPQLTSDDRNRVISLMDAKTLHILDTLKSS